MKIPDNFAELEKLFKDTEDQAPIDISSYTDSTVREIMYRLGNSLDRLRRFAKLQAPESVILDEVALLKKYKQVILLRKAEYLEEVRKINSGSPLPVDYEILEGIVPVCFAVFKEIQKRDQRKGRRERD